MLRTSPNNVALNIVQIFTLVFNLLKVHFKQALLVNKEKKWIENISIKD